MSNINTKFYTPNQLRNIREAVLGTSKSGGEIKLASAASTEAKNTNSNSGVQDVLILAPQDSIFKSDMDLSDSLEAQGLKLQQDFDDLGVTAQVTAEKASELKESGYRVYDNSPRPMWGLPAASSVAAPNAQGKWAMPEVKPVEWLKADQVQEAGRTGKGQTVAVLDSGFDHPEFELAGWKDVVDGSDVPVDKVGHGTHVAHDVLQAAPDADIVAVKVMGNDGTGRPSDIIAGIKYVLDQNAAGADIDIINMSLGGPPDGMPDTMDPINQAVEAATQAGVTVVAAAGNSGPNAMTIGSPAESASAIAVGAAFDPTTVSDFSSRGPTEDGLVKPDVMAPGEFISAWSVPGSEMEQTAKAVEQLRAMPAPALRKVLEENPQMAWSLGLPPILWRLMPDEEVEQTAKSNLPPTYIPEEGLVAAPGTSFAAPLVAGVLATLEEERDISPEESMAVLRSTADSMGPESGTVQGQGFVDAKEALDQVKSA